MEKECGEEWSHKINAIRDLFVKDRERIVNQRGIKDNKAV